MPRTTVIFPTTFLLVAAAVIVAQCKFAPSLCTWPSEVPHFSMMAARMKHFFTLYRAGKKMKRRQRRFSLQGWQQSNVNAAGAATTGIIQHGEYASAALTSLTTVFENDANASTIGKSTSQYYFTALFLSFQYGVVVMIICFLFVLSTLQIGLCSPAVDFP